MSYVQEICGSPATLAPWARACKCFQVSEIWRNMKELWRIYEEQRAYIEGERSEFFQVLGPMGKLGIFSSRRNMKKYMENKRSLPIIRVLGLEKIPRSSPYLCRYQAGGVAISSFRSTPEKRHETYVIMMKIWRNMWLWELEERSEVWVVMYIFHPI